jgi:hypothetical protein
MNMTWLKKVGQYALKIIGLWPVVAPFVAKLVPGVDIVSQIVGVVVAVEQMFTAASDPNAKTGSQKLKAATPQVAQLIQSTAFFQGKAVKNEALAEQAYTNITSAFADLLNAYGD